MFISSLKHIQTWLNETHFSKSYVVIKPPSRHFPTRFHFWARTSLSHLAHVITTLSAQTFEGLV